jgi:hypothetical protein
MVMQAGWLHDIDAALAGFHNTGDKCASNRTCHAAGGRVAHPAVLRQALPFFQ